MTNLIKFKLIIHANEQQTTKRQKKKLNDVVMCQLIV